MSHIGPTQAFRDVKYPFDRILEPKVCNVSLVYTLATFGELKMAIKQVPVEEAMQLKYPEWVLFVITVSPEGKANIMPAGWAMVCSFQPRMMAIAIGAGRYTAELIRTTGEFVLAFLSERQAPLIEFAGTHTGRQVDKFEQMGLVKAPPVVIAVPLLADSPLQFECRLSSAMPTGDHTIFAAEVVAAHVSDPLEPKVENFHRLYRPAAPA